MCSCKQISSTFLDEIPMDADPRNRDACVFVKKFASELSGAHQAARLALLAGGSPLAPIKLRERFNHDERITIVEVGERKHQ